MISALNWKHSFDVSETIKVQLRKNRERRYDYLYAYSQFYYKKEVRET